MKDKKGIKITNTFQRVLNESGGKPNKIWVDKGEQFYSRSVKSLLQDNDIEMSSTYNEGKSVFVERFVSNLKSKIDKDTVCVY